MLTSLSAIAQTEEPLSIDQMQGDYIILNSKEYEGVKSLADMRNMSFTPVSGEDSLTVSGFYMNKCPDFKVGYDESTGDVTIPAGTLVFSSDNMVQYLYLWDEDNQEVTYRPIIYRYQGNGIWTASNTIVLMSGYVGGTLTAYYFAQGSEIRLSNAISHNQSYAGMGDDQQFFDEQRPSFFRLVDNEAVVYNLLTTDQFGYGCKVEGEVNQSTGEATFLPSVVGQANDGTYKILAGCEVDEANNVPTVVSNKGTSTEGDITAQIDMTEGKLVFGPMAIFPAIYENGYLTIDDGSFYELVKSTELSFDPEKIVSINPEELTEELTKEVAHVEYYSLEGVRTEYPESGKIYIRKTVYKDNTVKVEKIYVNNQ